MFGNNTCIYIRKYLLFKRIFFFLNVHITDLFIMDKVNCGSSIPVRFIKVKADSWFLCLNIWDHNIADVKY